MQLTRDQVKVILKNAPKGTTTQAILDGLIQRGYDIEGVDSNAVRQQLQSAEQAKQPEEGPGYFGTAGNKLKSNVEDITSSMKTFMTGPQVNANDNLGQTLSKGAGYFLRDVPRAALRTVGGIASAITTPIFNAPGIKQAIGDMGYSLSKIPGAKWLGENLGKLAAEHPEIAKDLTNIGDIAAVSGMGSTSLMKKSVSQAGKDIVSAPGNIVNTLGTQGGNVLDKAQSIINSGKGKLVESVSPIDKGVVTVLNKTGSKSKLVEYAKMAEDKVIDYSKPSPLELAGNKAGEALDVIQSKVKQLGNLKRNSIGTFGDTKVGTIATSFKQKLQNYISGKEFIEGDKGVLGNIMKNAEKLGNNPTARQVDEFIDYAQDVLYSSSKNLAIPVTDSITAMLKKLVGELNSGLKSKLPSAYGTFNDKLSSVLELRNTLNKALGIEGNKGASLMKQLFSPSGTAPRKLFEEIKELTGIDLVDEATLAKFVMENIGDARQASLLEEIIKLRNPKSFIAGQAEKLLRNQLPTSVERATKIAK